MHGAAIAAEVIDNIERSHPAIAQELDQRPKVRDWIAAQFDGDDLGLEVQWDPDEPVSGRAAEHEYLTGRGPVVVRVSHRRSGLDQLAALIFELHNMRGHRVFSRVYLDAVQGEIGPNEFALRNLDQEHKARLATRSFLSEHFRDLTRAELSENRVLSALLAPVPTPEAQLAEARRAGGDLQEFYRQYFDSYVIPERQLRTRIEEWNVALARCDIAALDLMVVDTYRHTRGSDAPLTKSQWLARIESRSGNDCEIRGRRVIGDLDIIITGDNAIVTGHTSTAASAGRESHPAERRFTAVWMLESSEWKRSAFHDAGN